MVYKFNIRTKKYLKSRKCSILIYVFSVLQLRMFVIFNATIRKNFILGSNCVTYNITNLYVYEKKTKYSLRFWVIINTYNRVVIINIYNRIVLLVMVCKGTMIQIKLCKLTTNYNNLYNFVIITKIIIFYY